MRPLRTALCCSFAALLLAAEPAPAQDAVSGGIDLLELHFGKGEEHFTFDGRLTAGSGPNQFVLNFTGGSDVGPRVDNVELRGLYARELADEIHLLAGVRQDIRPGSDLTHGAMGIEVTLAPWLSGETYSFLSDQGDVTGDAELVGSFGLSDALILEPRIGVGWSMQDIAAEDTASGFSDMEASVRLRHTLFGNTNAYVGAIHERLLGGTRAIAEASGDAAVINRLTVGLATQF